jgi:hypothetical protein
MAAADNQSAPPGHIGQDARLLIYRVEKTHAPDLKSAVPKERPTIAQRFNAGYRTMVSKSRRDGRIAYSQKAEFTHPRCPIFADSLARSSLLIRVYPGKSGAKIFLPCAAPASDPIHPDQIPHSKSLSQVLFPQRVPTHSNPCAPPWGIRPTPAGRRRSQGTQICLWWCLSGKG